MDTVENMLNNLGAIEDWINEAPNPEDFSDNNEFMEFSVELMSQCLYLLKVGVVLVPSAGVAEKGDTKNTAIIVGHMVRVYKLYEGLLIHVSNRQLELAMIFTRLIHETRGRMIYLIRSNTPNESIQSFVLASYRTEKKMLADLQEKENERDLIPIEKRMKHSIETRLHEDGITLEALTNNKIWNIDGKNFRSILKELGEDHKYDYSFGAGSGAIHGSWLHIDFFDLNKTDSYYKPKIQYTDPDPRISCPLTIGCLDVLEEFLVWRNSDPDEVLLPIVRRLRDLTRVLDIAHEATFND